MPAKATERLRVALTLVLASLAGGGLAGCHGPAHRQATTTAGGTPPGGGESRTDAAESTAGEAGDQAPAVAPATGPIMLVKQDGKAVAFGSLKGKVLLVSFIYTRCPSPTMCPLVTRKFVRVQEQIGEAGDEALLLLVSLDPDYDRPKVLREYGELNHADPSNLWFLTGERAQVERLWKLFGIHRKEEKPGVIAHTMDAFLIDAQGNMSHIFPGSFWEVDEVADAILALVEGEDG